MTNETQNEIIETESDEQASELDSATAKAVSTLFGIGRLWAAHGLGIGRSALTASAVTLRSTAELLGEIGDRFEAEDEPAKS